MKKNLTELVFIIDRSGSMAGMESDTIGGFNSMIGKQRAEPSEALVSTVLFNHAQKVVHDRAPLAAVRPMTRSDYVAGGSTALLDAIGGAIHHIGNVHKYARAEDVPEHTLFVIITDGMENASRAWTQPQVKQAIERQKRKYGWEFLFLGANIDAIETAAQFSIAPEMSATYCADAEGTRLNYESVSDVIGSVRASQPIGADWKERIEEKLRRGR